MSACATMTGPTTVLSEKACYPPRAAIRHRGMSPLALWWVVFLRASPSFLPGVAGKGKGRRQPTMPQIIMVQSVDGSRSRCSAGQRGGCCAGRPLAGPAGGHGSPRSQHSPPIATLPYPARQDACGHPASAFSHAGQSATSPPAVVCHARRPNRTRPSSGTIAATLPPKQNPPFIHLWRCHPIGTETRPTQVPWKRL